MNFEAYRKELEAQVRAAKEASRLQQRRLAAAKSPGKSMETRDSDDAKVPATLQDPGADPAIRVQALTAYLASAARESQKLEVLLRYLSDPKAPSVLRLACLQRLQLMTFSSRSASDWRKNFVEALRSASEAEDSGLRRAAFELLTNFNDRLSQEVLLEGLEHPERARIAPEHALRLLAENPHTRVAAVARKFVAQPPAEGGQEARLEALRVLASDPGFKERFAQILTDAREAAKVRMLAATALSSLDLQLLRSVAAKLGKGGGAARLAATADDPVSRHVRGLLERR